MVASSKPVFVTGANGFVGGALVQHLVAQGQPVRGLVRSVAKGTSVAGWGAEPVVGDLADPATFAASLAGCDVIYNVGAALKGPASVQYAVNVTGVKRLVQAAAQVGVQRIVHVSSIAVYGYDEAGLIDETCPPAPGREFYGQSKALGERALFETAAACSLETTVVRPGMIYGPRSGFWTGKMFDFARRQPVLLPGAGLTYCPVIYIDDLIALLELAAEHPRAVGEVFNAVTDEKMTWRAFFGAYAAMAGHQSFLPVPVGLLKLGSAVGEPLLRVTGEPQPIRGMVQTLIAEERLISVAKAAQLLGWHPQVGLVEGMACAEHWLRETGRLI